MERGLASMADEKDPKEIKEQVIAAVAEHNRESNKDPEEEFLADAARRAYDEELEMLANIAIIRSTMLGREKMKTENGATDGKSRQQELERRLLFQMRRDIQPDPMEDVRRKLAAHRPQPDDETESESTKA